MNLGLIEDHLLRALRTELGAGVDWHTGPVLAGPATGLRAQVFVHALAFDDLGDVTAAGASIARQPLVVPGGLSGFSSQRPATLQVDLSCLAADHRQAQTLAGVVVGVALEALETLAPPLLSDPADSARRLHLSDHQANVLALRSGGFGIGEAQAAQVVLRLQLVGFVHLQLARVGGLRRLSAYEVPLSLQIALGTPGHGVQDEHVVLHNAGGSAVNLAGWCLHDAVQRPHRYTFGPTQRLAAGGSLRLWTSRGTDDASNLYWGRRQAVWNNTGDVALLRDPDGVERARAACAPAMPVPAAVGSTTGPNTGPTTGRSTGRSTVPTTKHTTSPATAPSPSKRRAPRRTR